MKKHAPNQTDQKQIKKMALEGLSPEEISTKLQIDLAPVESWTQHFIDEDKAQKDAQVAAEKAAKEAAEKAAAEEREKLKAEIRAEMEAEAKAAKKVNK